MLVSAEQHGKHVISNLENLVFFRSNHYLGDIAGLYFLAQLCPVLKDSNRWQKFAKKELEREILMQTFDDGWDYECSTAYHRLVLEMFYYCFLIGESTGDYFSQSYKGRLTKMIECILYTTKPNKELPQIGDNDSGRFLVFNCDRECASLNMEYIGYWKSKIANRKCGYSFMVLGGSSQRAESQTIKTDHVDKSRFFNDAGRYVFRYRNVFFLVSAQRKSPNMINSHSHNDVCGFELNVSEKDIFVDPGSYVYTSDIIQRNLFRSINNHNTLYWEGIEPCSLDDGTFVLPEAGILTVDEVLIGDEVEVFSGRYEYQGRFHHRRILFFKMKGEIVIRDICSHENARLTFMCAPGLKPELRDKGFFVGGVEVSFNGCFKMELVRAGYSPAYGEKLMTSKVVVSLDQKKRIETTMKIEAES